MVPSPPPLSLSGLVLGAGVDAYVRRGKGPIKLVLAKRISEKKKKNFFLLSVGNRYKSHAVFYILVVFENILIFGDTSE